MPKDPRTSFDVFWHSFAENYPFFAAKGVDWEGVRGRYRPKVHKDTSREELFGIFSDMVRPLYDAHVAVRDGERVFAQVRPGTEMPSPQLDSRVKAFISERDLKGAPYRRDFANGRITYADLPGRVGQGYLRISGFAGYADEGSPYAAHLAELDRALETVLTSDRTRRLTGLIIDLRINGGGSDALGIRIAERLTDTPYVAYAKRARNHPTAPDRHTRPEPIRVIPADGPRYTGPIAVLTGGTTVSAGETFTQALIDRPGYTVRIGQPTQGVFSDVMESNLPNGMMAMPPERGVPEPVGPDLRRLRHPAPRHGAGVHEGGVRGEEGLRVRPGCPCAAGSGLSRALKCRCRAARFVPVSCFSGPPQGRFASASPIGLRPPLDPGR